MDVLDSFHSRSLVLQCLLVVYTCKGTVDILQILSRVERPSQVKIIYNSIRVVVNCSQQKSIGRARRGPAITYRDFVKFRVQIRRQDQHRFHAFFIHVITTYTSITIINFTPSLQNESIQLPHYYKATLEADCSINDTSRTRRSRKGNNKHRSSKTPGVQQNLI